MKGRFWRKAPGRFMQFDRYETSAQKLKKEGG